MSEIHSSAPQLPPPPRAGFDFARPFTFVFEDPNWMRKILLGGVFYLLGFLLIGWFFILGYLAQVTRNVVLGHDQPLPEWDDLGGYFGEGARLFGVALCWILPIILLAFAVMIPAGLLGALENHNGAQLLGSGISGCFACLMVPISLAVLVLMPASLLFAMVEKRFGAAFEFGRIIPFIRANLGNYLMAVVVYLIARFLGGFGIILLCIGVVFTGFWSFLITAHGFAQAYRLATR